MDSPAKICMTNQKGGVGKSTISINLCGALAQRGHDVLLVDTDPHGDTTRHLGFDEYFGDQTVEISLYDCLLDTDHMDDIEETITSVGDEFDLARANKQMTYRLRGDLESATKPGQRLTMALESVEQRYDYVVVDTPPTVEKITTNGIIYAKNVLVPSYAEQMSIGGFKILKDQIGEIQEFYPDVGYLGFVSNRMDNSNEAQQLFTELEETFGDIFPIWRVKKRNALPDAITDGHGTIYTYDEKDDEHDLVFYDMAAWLDDYFGIDCDHTVHDIFSEEELRNKVVYGQIDTEHLAHVGEDVDSVIEQRADQ